ncbi:MAG: hypothetical protein ACOZNI_01835 [Myxococcota bacterium]
MLLLLLLACPGHADSPEDCVPTYGDNCGCEEQCMTEAQLEAIRLQCDLACDKNDTGGPDWTCAVDNGRCVVAE